MKTTLSPVRQALRMTVAGLMLALMPLALSAQQEWHEAHGFSQPKQLPQIKVKKVAQTGAAMSFEYALPQAICKSIAAGQTTQRVNLGSAPLRSRPGEPCLPVIPVQIVLPAGTTLDKATIRTGTPVELAGSHRIEHGQKAIPLNGKGKMVHTDPDASIYESNAPYPAQMIEVVGIQKKRGVSIAIVNIYPVVYRPRDGKVASCTSLTLDISLRPETNTAAPRRIPAPKPEFFPSVENPEEFDTYMELPTADTEGIHPLGLCIPAESFQYVVVTADSFATATTDVTVRDLMIHKQSRGITATIVTIENVIASYTGVDNAERLRNFITDAWINWETEYILLGGDIGIIPMRKLYCSAGGEIDQIPSDLYYQCLDGTYNADNDSYWGETTDGPGGTDVDLMAELFIGRASAENKIEMSNFVYKTLAYENASEAAPFLRKVLSVGEHLGFGGISEYATESMEEIRLGSSANGYSTVGFASSPLFTVDTLYDGPGYSWPASEILSRMNSGVYSIYNHLGHANYDYVNKFENSDADALFNDNLFFAYSQGCIPGNFEADCVAEHLTTSHRHGAFAVVFNARYGWGQFSSTDGPSQRFHRQFWDACFSEYMQNLGALNADSHEDNLWDINGDCIRWCFYETNLLGDPQTQVRGLVDRPMVQYRSPTTSGAAGNRNGLVNPEEPINLRTSLTNAGSTAAEGVTMPLSSNDPHVTITDNSAAADTIQCCGAALSESGTLPPDIAVSPAAFDVHLAPGTQTTRALTISNSGTDALEYNLSIDLLPADQLNVSSASFAAKRAAALAVRDLLSLPNDAVFSASTEASGSYTPVRVPDKINFTPMANNNVLIFRDNYPWGNNVNEPILTALGASVSSAGSTLMATIDLTPFDVIIFESQQPAQFYALYAASRARFEQFLLSGGIISFHCATLSGDRMPNLPLPGGMRTLALGQTATTNMVQDSAHPIVTGAPATMTGNSASHEAFENLPQGAHTIVINSQGNPTVVEYEVGAGLLIATGMTWEYGYANGSSSGNPILPNALAYMVNVALVPQWLGASPTSGTVQGGTTSNVTLGISAIGLAAGSYTATLSIAHNALEPSITVPVTLQVETSGASYVSMITSIGIAASLKATGSEYSLTDLKIGAPVSGLLRGSRYQLKLW